MPNWVRNRIVVNSKHIDELIKDHVKVDEEGNETFDFNTVIPMPKDLDIECGSKSNDGLCLYMTKTCPAVDYFGSKEDKAKDWDEISESMKHMLLINDKLVLEEADIERLQKKYEDEFDEVVSLGKKQVENAKNYGALTWYDWCIDNWGTKWNSASTVIDRDKGRIEFDTAWDPAVPVFEELTKLHPSIPMALLYADEAIGCHTGYELMTNGKADYRGSFPDESKAAYEEALDLWDCKDEYKYVPAKKRYVRKDEMEM